MAIADLNLDRARETAREIGADALALSLDVANAESVQNTVDECLYTWGRIDILVNNAGIVGRDVPVKDLTEGDWDRVFDINLKGTFLCSRAVIAPMLKQKKGAIVSVASIAGKEGNPSMAPYSVSKAGIICFTKVLAKEHLQDNIRVNCVSPSSDRNPTLSRCGARATRLHDFQNSPRSPRSARRSRRGCSFSRIRRCFFCDRAVL